MNIKEIVCCYVSESLEAPSDMKALRESFIANGFKEQEISPNKFKYKRGTAIALEFNYDSEAIEMQVILESSGNELTVTVGNWGFPFEPLMMKSRFKRFLSFPVESIRASGVLPKSDQVSEIEKDANSKKKAAIYAIVYALLGVLVYGFIKNT